MVTRLFLILIVGAMSLLTSCSGDTDQPRAVILIVVDTLRPDALSCYGNDGNPTPAIDGLASSGVLFRTTFSTGSWTVPSMGSIMTSLYPVQLGLVERKADPKGMEWRKRRTQQRYTLPPGVPTMARMFKQAGFVTAAFVNQPFINGHDGFLAGFDEWCYSAREDSIAWHETSLPFPEITYPPGTDIGKADPLLLEQFIAWLDQHQDERPFVWLHLIKPHTPYRPDPAFIVGQGDPGKMHPAALYSAEVREADAMVGRALQAIDETIGLDKAIVVFVSDHGEAFGEHQMYEHGHTLFNEVIRVPMIIAGPGIPAGIDIGLPVRIIDIMPTLAELARIGMNAPQHMEGQSLVPMINGGQVGLEVYSEGMLYGPTERSLIMRGLKLIADEGLDDPHRLFDLRKDARELAPISGDPRQELLVERMDQIHERLLRTPAQSEVPEEEDRTRVIKSLKALGYIGGSAERPDTTSRTTVEP